MRAAFSLYLSLSLKVVYFVCCIVFFLFLPHSCFRMSSSPQPCSSLMDDQRALTTESSTTKPISSGLHVLVVDDDVTCLKVVEVMLRKLQYEVVAAQHASDALAILRDRRGGFDIILTDLHMPDMDGISLLEHVDVEFKIPVIMMSANDKEAVASRCLESGASFYLTKPLSRSDLSNLWQYVYLKKRDETMVIDNIGRNSEIPIPEKVSKEDTDSASSVNESTWREESRTISNTKKEQNKGGKENDNLTQKKLRVAWDTNIHNKFLDAIDQIGLHRAVPTKILEVMNEPGLTRENVASHLQKYRIFLRRVREVSQFGEPRALRSLTNRFFKSSFASGNPSSLLRSGQGFSHISKQQRACKSFQPRLQRCSTSQLGVEKSLPKKNHKNLKQPSLDIISSVDPQNDAKKAMIHQQPQANSGPFAHGLLDHRFNTTSLPGENIPNVGSIRSFNNHNQVSKFSYINNDFAGIQRNGSGNLFGFNQMPIAYGSSNGANCGYSRVDEIRNGKMPEADTIRKSPLVPGIMSSHSGYAAQGLPSSNGFVPQGLSPPGGLVPQGSIPFSGFSSINPFSPIFANVGQQMPLFSPSPPPPPPPLPQQQTQKDTEVAAEVDIISELIKSNCDIVMGEEVDSIFELAENNSPFGNLSFAPPFDEQEVCGEVMDPDFNINSGQVDKDNLSPWIQP